MVDDGRTNAAARAAGRVLGVLSLLALAAACTYRGNIDAPYTIKATWFSYLNGDDIRRRCRQPGALPETRLIYNGNYREQLRSYELVATGAGGAYLTARAMTKANLTSVNLADPLAAWRWKKSQARLSAEEAASLERAFRDSGLFGPAPDGLRLDSHGFYWIAIACRDGKVHFNAWRYSSPRWQQLTFPQKLLAHDETGVPLNPARELTASPRELAAKLGRRASARFVLEVGENGLVGLP